MNKAHKAAAKDKKGPVKTKIQVWNDALKSYKYEVCRDDAKSVCVIVAAFHLFEKFLGEEYCKQWDNI